MIIGIIWISRIKNAGWTENTLDHSLNIIGI